MALSRFAFLVYFAVWSGPGPAHSKSAQSTVCIGSDSIGAPCHPLASAWPVQSCHDSATYLDCVPSENGTRIVIFNCSTSKFCNLNRTKRQNGIFGSTCFYNTDCQSGMYCNAGRCVCLSTYVQRDNYCYEKINPGQSGCVYNEQCSGVWARATCVNGVCACPSVQAISSGSLVPVQTRDGVVCAADTYCPLPVDDGLITVLEPTVAVCTSATDCAKADALTAPGAETISELYECSALSACCPNRAYTCSLPMGAPPSTGTGWWYNSATGNCQQIVSKNNGAGINSNNFVTEEHCRSYCGSVCPRGNPQYAHGKAVYCGAGETCDTNYKCATIGSQRRCCPKASFVCSRNGGVGITPTSQTTEYNPGFQNSVFSTQPSITRYYFDPQTRQCSSFSYLGSGGNFNNFASLADCQSYCVQQVFCSKGNPLPDPDGKIQQCSENVACPQTHSCTNSVCCPTRQTICSQARQAGSCTQLVERFWYNSASRQCEQFVYSGCQGNDNNFATLMECQNFCKASAPEPQCPQGKALRDRSGNFVACSLTTGTSGQCPINHECHFDGSVFSCCPVKSFTCALSANSGVPCGARSLRWSFDSRIGACTSFIFFGCDGNSNNFPSQEQCESYCGIPTCPNGGQPLTDSPSGRLRLCSTSAPCPSSHECTLIAGSTTASVSCCCPTRAFICRQPPNAGQYCNGAASCKISSPNRFYFSPDSKSCLPLVYNGCDGNANNFHTSQQCLTFCSSAGCPNGQNAYTDPRTQRPLTCDSKDSTCPSGYSCQYDAVGQRNVCCGSSYMDVCPASERAYADSKTGDAKICTPGQTNTCPPSYLCRFSVARKCHYCCAPPASAQCSIGHIPYLMPGTKEPIACSAGSALCPTGYTCTSTSGDVQGYCCTIAPVCPLGHTVLHDGSEAQTCTVGMPNACPSPYQCVSTSNSTRGYCCNRVSNVTNVCTVGAPYLLNDTPVVCDRLSPNPCPTGYQCQLHTSTKIYYCCSASSGDGTDLCLSGTAYVLDNAPQRCSATGRDKCPQGYVCSPSLAGGSVRYCCTVSSDDACNSGKAYEYAPGIPLSCDSVLDRCPSGFACKFHKHSNSYFCCKGTCPKGGALINHNCSPNVPGSCPPGHTCQYIKFNARYQCCSGTANATDLGECPESGLDFPDRLSRTVALRRCGSTATTEKCPVGYTCQRSTTNAAVCCPDESDPQSITCADDGQPYLTAQNETVRCDDGRCPADAICSGVSNERRYCCKTGAAVTCPPGRRAYISPASRFVEECYPPDSCPHGYSCHRPPGVELGVCCSDADSESKNVCPNGGRPFLYQLTRLPLACTPINDRCPNGFVCTKAAKGLHYCCTVGIMATQGMSSAQSGCPSGMKPLLISKKSNNSFDQGRNVAGEAVVQECTPSRPDQCRRPYKCTFSIANSRYQCCANAAPSKRLRRPALKRNPRCPRFYTTIDGDCVSGQSGPRRPAV